MNSWFVGALAVLLAIPVEGAAQPQAPAPAAPAATPAPQVLQIAKAFHITGIPGMGRNTRVRVTLTESEFIFHKGSREAFRLPFTRVQRADLLISERNYPEASYVAGMATPFGIGALLILKKRKMDTLVMDFRSERGGLMGLVVQLPKGQGALCKDFLAKRGLTLEEPPALPEKADKKKPA